ncbi:MAG: hypothetical protein AAGE52_37405 [Myxococcota bacterium]
MSKLARKVLLLLGAVAGFLWSSDGFAERRPIVISFLRELPESCPGAGIAADVARRLGRDPFVAGEAEMRVRLRGTARARGWQVEVVVERRGVVQGTRRFEAATCAELGDRAALILALVVDTQVPVIVERERTRERRQRIRRRQAERRRAEAEAEAQAQSTEPEPEPETEPEAEPETEPETEPEPEPDPEPMPPPERDALEAGLYLDGGGHVGWFPTLTPGGGVSVVLLFPKTWALHLRALAWGASDDRSDGRGVRLRGVAARVGLCPGAVVGVARLAGCLVIEPGALRAEGIGFDENESVWRASLRAGLEARLTLRFGAFRLAFALGIDAPLLRDRFTFEGADRSTGVAHDPAPVGGLLLLSIGAAI